MMLVHQQRPQKHDPRFRSGSSLLVLEHFVLARLKSAWLSSGGLNVICYNILADL